MGYRSATELLPDKRLRCVARAWLEVPGVAGSGLADTVDHYPAHATTHTGLRDHAVGLMNGATGLA
jgi:hypothetical protein